MATRHKFKLMRKRETGDRAGLQTIDGDFALLNRAAESFLGIHRFAAKALA